MLQQDFNNEASKQFSHSDFAGDRKYFALCQSNGISIEHGCGLNGYSCNGGDFY